MATSYADLEMRIRDMLHEPEAARSFFSPRLTKTAINLSYRRRCEQMIRTAENFFVQTAVRDIVALQEFYSFPPGLVTLKKLELIRVDGTRVPILRFERHFLNLDSTNGIDYEYISPRYQLISGGFRIEPVSLNTMTDGLRIEYTFMPGPLGSPGDMLHPDYPEIFSDLIALDAAITLLDSEGLLESQAGLKTLLRARMELEQDFISYINTRSVSTQSIQPFIVYGDS